MIKTELEKLKKRDIYSLMLFALYKLEDIPQFSALSELAYILDKDNLLKLCEYFGGLTIKIPTIEELDSILCSLLLYQYINIDHMDYSSAVELLGKSSSELRKIKSDYLKIVDILKDYSFEERI